MPDTKHQTFEVANDDDALNKAQTAIPDGLDRAAQRQAFLEAHGYGDAKLTQISGDASFRHYFRITPTGDPQSYMLMDSPIRRQRLPEFVAIATELHRHGLRAPEIFAADLEKGFALVEDLGDLTFADLFNAGTITDRKDYFIAATDALVRLHKNFTPAGSTVTLPPLAERLRFENDYVTDWLYPARHDHETPPDVLAEFQARWEQVLTTIPPLPDTLVMVDYHAPNLLPLVGKSGADHIGMIDFQDACLGSPVYDVMSLIEDDRRMTEPELAEIVKKHYLREMADDIDPDMFHTHFAVLSVHRHAKNMGNFIRIAVQRDAKEFLGYLSVPTALFHAQINHPAVASVKAWYDRYCDTYEPLGDIRTWMQAKEFKGD